MKTIAGVRMFDVDDLVKELGVCARTVHQLFADFKAGKPGLRTTRVGRRVYVSEDALLDFLTARGRGPTYTTPSGPVYEIPFAPVHQQRKHRVHTTPKRAPVSFSPRERAALEKAIAKGKARWRDDGTVEWIDSGEDE